jgi:excisionase family DNA binding protein
MNTEYLTIKEVAQLLSVHPNTVRNWIKTGKLPVLKTGKIIRILKTDIPTFLRK